MNTSYNKVFLAFLDNVMDFDFPKMSDEELSAYCTRLMNHSIAKIKPLENDLTQKDDLRRMFLCELLDIEIEIIACQMTAEWVSQKLYNTQLVTMFLGTKDEKFNSQANMIAALRGLRDDKLAEAHTLRRDWAYQNSELLEDE